MLYDTIYVITWCIVTNKPVTMESLQHLVGEEHAETIVNAISMALQDANAIIKEDE